jgi:hypothetical protein
VTCVTLISCLAYSHCNIMEKLRLVIVTPEFNLFWTVSITLSSKYISNRAKAIRMAHSLEIVELQWNHNSSFSLGGSDKKLWILKNDRSGGLYKSNKNGHVCPYVFTKSKYLHQWYYFHCRVQFALFHFKKAINRLFNIWYYFHCQLQFALFLFKKAINHLFNSTFPFQTE